MALFSNAQRHVNARTNGQPSPNLDATRPRLPHQARGPIDDGRDLRSVDVERPADTVPPPGVLDGYENTNGLDGPLGQVFGHFFPDKANDGEIFAANGTAYDFDSILKSPDRWRLLTAAAQPAPADAKVPLVIFVPGLGQTAEDASTRLADTAQHSGFAITQLHNGSFLKEKPLLSRLNPKLDWIDAGVHRAGLSASPAIRNVRKLVLQAIKDGEPLNFSADSHGTILLGRGLKEAKATFIHEHLRVYRGTTNLAEVEEAWNLATSKMNVVTFGNGFRNWPSGPNYLHVRIDGDPLPEKVGTHEGKPGAAGPRFLTFERFFPEGSFEAHNMKFTSRLLEATFEKNGLAQGDIEGLIARIDAGTLDAATAHDVDWGPMKDHQWDPNIDLKSLLQATA